MYAIVVYQIALYDITIKAYFNIYIYIPGNSSLAKKMSFCETTRIVVASGFFVVSRFYCRLHLPPKKNCRPRCLIGFRGVNMCLDNIT